MDPAIGAAKAMELLLLQNGIWVLFEVYPGIFVPFNIYAYSMTSGHFHVSEIADAFSFDP